MASQTRPPGLDEMGRISADCAKKFRERIRLCQDSKIRSLLIKGCGVTGKGNPLINQPVKAWSGQTPLTMTATLGSSSVFDLLVDEFGADPGAADEVRFTPLTVY